LPRLRWVECAIAYLSTIVFFVASSWAKGFVLFPACSEPSPRRSYSRDRRLPLLSADSWPSGASPRI